jgi:hypothetical protein
MAGAEEARTRSFATPVFAGCAFIDKDGRPEIGSGTAVGKQYLSAGWESDRDYLISIATAARLVGLPDA